MARIARNKISGEYFHILLSGLSELNIFAEHRMKQYYITGLLGSLSENMNLIGYCVLDNHVHVVLQCKTGIDEVGAMLKRLNTAFALAFNKLKGRSGYVFNGRYKCQVLADATEAAGCIYYVHSNPMFESVRFNPAQYPYSSYKLYVNQDELLKNFADELNISMAELFDFVNEAGKEYPLIHWMDIEKKIKYEDYTHVLNDLARKYHVSNYADVVRDKDTIGAFAYELNRRSGASLLYIAGEMGMGRETLRKCVKKYADSLKQKENRNA